jgi:hypothetical protein
MSIDIDAGLEEGKKKMRLVASEDLSSSLLTLKKRGDRSIPR